MKNYKKIIINKLLDSYEKSVIYKGSFTQSSNIYFQFTNQKLKDYFDETNYTLKDEIDNSCDELQENELIKIYRGKGYESHLIKKVALNLNRLKDAYSYVARIEKSSKEDEINKILQEFIGIHDILDRFIEDISLKLSQKLSIKKYLDIDDLNTAKDILYAISKVLLQDEEIFKRNFSAKIFNDSKKFEAIEGKVLKIIREYSKEHVKDLGEFNIINNYTYVYLKGNIIIKTDSSTLNIKDFKGGIAISSQDIENINEIKVLDKDIITIENLTTFNNYKNPESSLIYLGGFHNKVRRDLLRKIYSFNGDIKYYHWGDIDIGGFRIFNHLKLKTQIPFEPIYMDERTLNSYSSNCKVLNEKEIKTLQELIDDKTYLCFHGIIRRMLELGVKLEQEIII